MSSKARSVFVGNIPYDGTEQQLIEVFSTVGEVVSFRLVSDRETGHPKGFGFCEFLNTETAMSAIRNLNNFEFHGRSLKVDFADKNDSGRAPTVNMDLDKAQAPAQPAAKVPATPLEQLEIDSETMIQVIESIPDDEKLKVLAQMKILVNQDPEGARQLLSQNPQLAQAILHIQVNFGLLNLPDLLNFSMSAASAETVPHMPSDRSSGRFGPPAGGSHPPMGGPPADPYFNGPPAGDFRRVPPNLPPHYMNLPPKDLETLLNLTTLPPEQIRALQPKLQHEVLGLIDIIAAQQGAPPQGFHAPVPGPRRGY